MPGIPRPIKRFAIFCHRWMGLVFCVLFAWWFLSGFVILYWDYPAVEPADRLARSPALDPARVRLSPADALASLGASAPSPQGARLNTFDGRPVYRFLCNGIERMIYADSGEQPELSSPELSLRTAAAWTGQPAQAASAAWNTEPDQWTVQEFFQPLRPLRKFSWPGGEQVYVSLVTGEVVQYTTRASRLGAWLGAVPHWLYFTPLRKNHRLWSKIVIWASGLATVAALLGLIAGIGVYAPSKPYRYDGAPASIPYRGQKRWHTLLGLFFGIVACTWAFSGMLSMNPFPAPASENGAAAISAVLRGRIFELAAYTAKDPREALAQVASDFPVKELEFTFFAGAPIYLLTDGKHASRIIPVNGSPFDSFDRGRLTELIHQASRPAGVAELKWIDEYDAYYFDHRREKPLPVVRVLLNDRLDTRYYIDPRTAHVVASYNSTGWIERWLYHGLHSIDLPPLYNHRPAWDIVVLTLLLGGASLAVTGVILGFQLLRRKLFR